MPSQSFIPGFLLTNRARSVFSLARQLADVNSASISPKHVFQALATSERGNGRIALELCGLDLRTIIDDLQVSKLEKAPHQCGVPLKMDSSTEQLLAFAEEEAINIGRGNVIGTENLVLGILRHSESLECKLMERHGVDLIRMRTLLTRGRERGP